MVIGREDVLEERGRRCNKWKSEEKRERRRRRKKIRREGAENEDK